MRPPRRNERHPSLIRVETVNGAEAEPPEERPWFGELTVKFPTERLGELNGVPYGRGSRVAVGAAGAGGHDTPARGGQGARRGRDRAGRARGRAPEELAEWRELGPPVVGGSFERSPEAQAQAAELAVERGKRQAERGGHAVVVVDSLQALPPGTRRRIFGAGRASEEGGTLTILAAAGEDMETLRWATSRVVLASAAESGALRGDLLT